MRTTDDIKKIVDKDLHIQILRDTLEDFRAENHFIRKVVLILFTLLFFAISGIIFQAVYHQHRLFKFISEAEFTSEIWMDNDFSDKNNMSVERR